MQNRLFQINFDGEYALTKETIKGALAGMTGKHFKVEEIASEIIKEELGMKKETTKGKKVNG